MIDSIIVWEAWDALGDWSSIYYKARFIKAFGCFNTGETFGSVVFDYETGLITAYADDGTVVKQQRCQLHACEDISSPT